MPGRIVHSAITASLPYDAVVFGLDGVVANATGAHAGARSRRDDADGDDRHVSAGPGVRPFAGSVALIRRLRAGGVRLGLVTARHDARDLIAAAGLAGSFDGIVDGDVAASLGLAAMPDPAMFLEAARRLGVPVGRTAVVVGAASGVAAARRAGFRLVVGVDRTEARERLEAAGADFVLGDVGELDLGAAWRDPWLLVFEGFDPAHEAHREALTTLGNGYMATRGAHPERRDDGVHYPGTYVAGVYNRLLSDVRGRTLEDESIVNLPNWLPLDLRVDAGRPWSEGGLRMRDERRELDLRRGLLTRRGTLLGADGRRLRLVQRRLVSMHRPHLGALETSLVADGWSGDVWVTSGVDAEVRNGNVADFAELEGRHLEAVTVRHEPGGPLLVEVETIQSRVRIAVALETSASGEHAPAAPVAADRAGRRLRRTRIRLTDGVPTSVLTRAAIVTSRDPAASSPSSGALAELMRAPRRFESLLAEHEHAWRRLWDRFAVDLEVDTQTRLVLNLHVFHLLQSISPHTSEVDAGVPARGLHGEGYRGHVFWDEAFVLPMVALRLPRVARALMHYRWRRLPAARQAARRAGLRGALFPWQSGSDGREETPSWLYNPRSGRWMPDNSRLQRHVGLAVAHNAWLHHQVTGDRAWLRERGADLIIEVARLFASLARRDGPDDRWHIDGVMGPDEYHDGYPDSPGEGLRDNAYTNVMAAWVCGQATEILAGLAGHDCDDVMGRLDIEADEPHRWAELSRRLAVPFLADGVIGQFSGYGDLIELDWDRYRGEYGDIGRLDLILEAEDDSPNRYRLSKQADALMLVYMLGPEQLLEQLGRMGYAVTHADLVRTADFYRTRTAHGSTLSRVVEASILARIDGARSWSVFREALDADLDDTQGGTTGQGIHLGAMAGTLDLVHRAFAGMEIGDGWLGFSPRLPRELRRVGFQVEYRGQRIDVTVDHDTLRVSAHPCNAAPVRIRAAGREEPLAGGQRHVFDLSETTR